MVVEIKFLKLRDTARLPAYKTLGAAGADLFAAEPVEIGPGEVKLVPLGFSTSFPEGFEVQVRSRSGLAAKQSIFVLNSPGTVDSDYRGEWGVILANFGKDRFSVRAGDRIAQMVVNQTAQAVFTPVSELDETERASGGYGSTGIR